VQIAELEEKLRKKQLELDVAGAMRCRHVLRNVQHVGREYFRTRKIEVRIESFWCCRAVQLFVFSTSLTSPPPLPPPPASHATGAQSRIKVLEHELRVLQVIDDSGGSFVAIIVVVIIMHRLFRHIVKHFIIANINIVALLRSTIIFSFNPGQRKRC
jgi:hypothetical protein